MLELKVISPEKILFSGEVENVTVPGENGEFEILSNHAPIISTLKLGIVSYTTTDKEKKTVNILGGFAEVQKNKVNICVETP